MTSGSAGSGRGSATIRVEPNTSEKSRKGSVKIAGQTLNVTQQAAASVEFLPR